MALALALALGCGAAPRVAPDTHFTPKELVQGYRDGTVIAKPLAALVPTVGQAEAGEGMALRAEYKKFGYIRVLGLAGGEGVKAAIARLIATGRYQYVEPDYIRHAQVVPNDPDFPSQWALHNDGSGGGIAGADINAEAGWAVRTSASTVIAAVLDTGALTTHQDLQPNMWVNTAPGTVGSYSTVNANTGATTTVSETDSLNGLNAVTMSGLPTDDSSVGHGSHVSGIIGAVGNNGVGVSGVAWKVQLMELKFIDSSGNGSTSDELPCIEYAIRHGVKVINGSFGSQGFSQSEMDAIHEAGQSGIIFVCAAGNASENNDVSGFFPADYPLDNLVAVGASDNRDLPVYFSNYGSGSVSLFAPGENILSTYNQSTSAYEYLSGTSMASPFVAGTVALLLSQYPSDTYRETINRLLNCVDTKPGLAGKCMTGGRLDLAKALNGTAANTPPNALFANRTVLVGQDPYTCTNNADSPSALESGTPQIQGMAGSHSLWWQWTAPENATVEIDTSGTNGGEYPGGSTYATLLGVYTGTGLSSLVQVASDANYGAGKDTIEGTGETVSYSEVSFHTQAGVTYQINVQGQGSASGQTVLAINTTPDNDSFSTPFVLTGPSTSFLDTNNNATLESGEPQILGTAGGHSLWYSWTAPATGPVQVSAYSYDFTVEAAVYTGTTVGDLAVVSSAVGSAAAGTTTDISECQCSFSAAAGTTYLIKVDGVTASDYGEFTVSIDDAAWQVATLDAVTCSPAVAPDGTVYVGSNDNNLYAYTPSGAPKWTYTAATSVWDTSSAAVGPDGTIYAGNTDGTLYAINPAGTLDWKYTVPTPAASTGLDNGISSSPSLGSDGTVYFHDDDGNLYALTSAGALKWTVAVGGESYAAPTIAPDGTIYIGTDGGLFYAINPSGSIKWTYTAPVAGEEIYTAAALDAAGNIYFGTLSGNFYSLDPSANLRWSYSNGVGMTSAPALANGAVYFGGYDGILYSLSAANGTVNWKYTLGSQVRASAPAVDANGIVYIGCYDHNVYAVNPTGTLARIYASDDVIRSSPVVSGSALYFGSEDHKVYAFNLAAGPAASDWPMYQFGPQRLGRAVSSVLSITTQPASVSLYSGEALSLSVGALGPGTLTFQWYLNGTAIAGATGATYSVASATAANAGSYTVTVTASTGTLTSSAATVTVGAASTAGRIINLSARAYVGTGGNILIAGFVINGSGTKSVLLRGDGPALALSPFDLTGVLETPELTLINANSGSTVATDGAWGGGSSLSSEFTSVGAFALQPTSADSAVLENLAAGNYTSEIAGEGSTTGVALAEIYDADPASPSAYLSNISARAFVGTGSQVLIAGFAVSGAQPVTVLLRGIGPALGLAPFNLSGVLAQPQIQLYDSAGNVLQTNAGWGGGSVLANAFTQAGAFALAPTSADSAMIATLPAGNYTVILSGLSGTTGIGLVEVYLLP